MSYKIGLVGFPNVGKSSFFYFITKKNVLIANYPFATIDPAVGVMTFVDPRLNNLANAWQSLKISPSTIEWVDIAGLVRGAAQGLGLGNEFLSHIREVDIICHVIRAFHDNNIIHVEKNVNPWRDYEVIQLELIFADYQQVERKIEKVENLLKKQRDNEELKEELNLLKYLQENLEKEIPLLHLELSVEQKQKIKIYNLLTAKPSILIVNYNGENLDELTKLKNYADIKKIPLFSLSVKLEIDCQELTSKEKKELDFQNFDLVSLTNKIKKTLGLKTFFTAGPKESKSWLIEKEANARQGASLIHTDIAKGFIRAEIYSYEDWINSPNEEQLKKNGKIRKEGANYILKEGDICHFLFSK